MERRNFIKVLAAGSSIAVFPAAFSGCSGQTITPKALKTDYPDMRLKLISYAMLAPNPHNIQPWLIQLRGTDGFDLYVDQSRLLPETDPPARQIHIGQGTFLEGISIAGSAMGIRTEMQLFPEGEYGNQIIEEKPVARVRIFRDDSVKKDRLAAFMQDRQSNKRVYRDELFSGDLLNQILGQLNSSDFQVAYTTQPRTRRVLSAQMKEAMVIETSDPARHKETVDMFRFNDDEVAKTRDGFTIGNSGMAGMMRWIVETFFLGTRKDAEANDSAFAKETIKLTGNQADSAAAYGWIISRQNRRQDQVRVGRLYMRINLLATQAGIALHPMSQILEEYRDMQPLQSRFLTTLGVPEGQTVQMLFRMGFADLVQHTLRRSVPQILVS
ncbi:MAG: twin-arginine translocation pathway signal protein [Deltaproteobacteria bacterium]|jgi:hypothetical protein|nr:twin-arginine translocation pathway signal protein [Deltaproteobacteria bacterium]MBT4266427.1 twin-arginine translocation pathway signal protein [Deltaproteobacteria bacterium]MBT4643889.1 twin-arginine translocation pathway signal protein [Deltaproteobacteria bacterium]MBT6501993.1 twin-arginine translocation pathway signal protein [Deltaproteobacteria bacterium]MBT7150935.1 twin-arginine translocation pathway signal protein [Deltaproteobacteria bacterium]